MHTLGFVFSTLICEPMATETKTNRGDEFEDTCEQELVARGIPFRRGVRLVDRNNCLLAEFDFVLPGAVIEVKSGKHKDRREKAQMHLLLEYTPPDYVVYLYRPACLDDDASESKRVRHIKCLDDLKINLLEWPVYADDPAVLRSLGSTANTNYEVFLRMCNTTAAAQATKRVLERAIVMMNPDERTRFDKLAFSTVKSKPHRCIQLTNRKITLPKRTLVHSTAHDELFKVFFCYCRPFPLQSSKPLSLLPGVSIQCRHCHRIVFVEQCFSDNCIICRRSASRNSV